MAGFQTVLFDADETLFDYDKSGRAALFKTLDEFSVPYSDSVLKRFRAISGALWQQNEKGEITKKELATRRFELLFRELDVRVDIASFNARYFAALAASPDLIEGAKELCETLFPAAELHIVTNGFSQTQWGRIEHSAIRPFLGKIFISEEIGYEKPQKGFFDAVFAKLGISDRSGTILLGDSLSSDMAGAVAAGIAGCWYNPSKKPGRPEGIDYEISSLSEFIPIVKG